MSSSYAIYSPVEVGAADLPRHGGAEVVPQHAAPQPRARPHLGHHHRPPADRGHVAPLHRQGRWCGRPRHLPLGVDLAQLPHPRRVRRHAPRPAHGLVLGHAPG